MIETVTARADELTAAVNHDTMKRRVQEALRDLKEARLWLNQPDIENRQPILMIVDTAIMLAQNKLNYVANALQTYGPDAMEIG